MYKQIISLGNQMIRLSIIVPFYNVEKYIEQCIRSLYDQDIPQEEYEVICVDDCSLDGSRAIVERLQKEYPNLQLIIHERNKKLGGARNTGLRAAQGEYVLFVDSDDYILPNKYKGLLDKADRFSVDFLHFDNLIDLNGQVFHDNGYEIYNTTLITGIDLFLFPTMQWQGSHIVAWKKLYRKSFLIENHLYFVEDTMYEDNDFCFRVYALAKKVIHIGDDVYVYRINENSITHTGDNLQKYNYRILSTFAMISAYHIVLKHTENEEFLNIMIQFISWHISYILANKSCIDYARLFKSVCRCKAHILFPYCSWKQKIQILKTIYF